LETLRVAGYVERSLDDQSYQPTVMVRALSEGFDDEAMVAHIARPHLTALCASIVWPIAIATPAADAMVIRETTDRQSPLALEQLSAGIRVSMLGSAAGRAYLAYCPSQQREKLLELLMKSPSAEDRVVRDRVEVERILGETRTQGYGMAHRARRVSDEISLAIPVREKDRVLATISVRYSANAVSTRTALEQFLPKMREAVLTIEREFRAA
jgi:IclR family mhp operon transcriptional activator